MLRYTASGITSRAEANPTGIAAADTHNSDICGMCHEPLKSYKYCIWLGPVVDAVVTVVWHVQQQLLDLIRAAGALASIWHCSTRTVNGPVASTCSSKSGHTNLLARLTYIIRQHPRCKLSPAHEVSQTLEAN
jgi:hypothetical protein